MHTSLNSTNNYFGMLYINIGFTVVIGQKEENVNIVITQFVHKIPTLALLNKNNHNHFCFNKVWSL